jgi:hypothetical protein
MLDLARRKKSAPGKSAAGRAFAAQDRVFWLVDMFENVRLNARQLTGRRNI